MARTNPEARFRLVATAADMLRRRGMNAMSIRELAKAAKAPLGSTYHYFPDGKKQVVSEALEYAGNKVTSLLIDALEKGPLGGVNAFLSMWRTVIIETNYRAGCPVIAVAMEEAVNDEIEEAHLQAAKIFTHWQTLLSQSLMDQAVEEEYARQLAALIIASAEGALAMCRAQKSTEAFDQVSVQLQSIVKIAIKNSV